MTEVTVSPKKLKDAEGQKIASVKLREPMAGEMRGLKLADVLQLDVNALITLIPRISNPPLLEAQVAGMTPADIARFGGAVVGFFEQADG